MVSFAVQKLLSQSHLFIFVFIFITVGGGSKDLVIYVRVFFPMLSSKIFIVSAFTFRSLIRFEFIFVCGLRTALISFFYM